MNLTHIQALLLRQFWLMRDNTVRIVPLIIWTFLEVTVWGFTMVYLTHESGSSYSFVPLILGAVLLWEFLVRAMHNVNTPFFEDMWSHNFLNIFASPLTRAEYLVGVIVVSTVLSLIAFTIVVVFASYAFGLSLISLGVPLIFFLLSLFMFGIALGIFGISIILRFGPSSEWLIWPMPAVIVPFVGVYYPAASLPVWMQMISVILPPRYVFDGMRSIITTGTLSYPALLWSIVLSAVYVALAVLCFELVYRRAVKLGLIARYSAESV